MKSLDTLSAHGNEGLPSTTSSVTPDQFDNMRRYKKAKEVEAREIALLTSKGREEFSATRAARPQTKRPEDSSTMTAGN